MIFVVILLFITGLVIGVLALNGFFNKKQPVSPTPPDLGLEVVAVSPDQTNIIYDNKDIEEDSEDGKYFYFTRGTSEQYNNMRDLIRNKYGNFTDSNNEIPVQQWRNTGSKYEKIWEGTVNLISGVGGRLHPYNLDQTNTEQINKNAAIWKIGDYVVYNGNLIIN